MRITRKFKCEVMCTLRYCIYYDPAGENVGLEGRRLMLTLLASPSSKFSSIIATMKFPQSLAMKTSLGESCKFQMSSNQYNVVLPQL